MSRNNRDYISCRNPAATKATPATATAGLAGESKNGETPENVVGRVPKTPTRSKGAKKNG